MNESFKLAFEPFVEFDPSRPFKLLPEGKFYRGDRELIVTKERLMEIEQNFKDGRPQFRIPINLDHADDKGKVGDITEIQYMADGPKGPGLYVTGFELTDKGRQKIEDDGYDAVSAEVVWTLAGHTFQDIETGKEHDNVLVGMALTPTPYFGHGHVALYSADAPVAYGAPSEVVTFEQYDEWMAAQEQAESVAKTLDVIGMLNRNIMQQEDVGLFDKLKQSASLLQDALDRAKTGGEDVLSDDTQPDEFSGDITEATEELPEDFEADNTAEEEIVEEEKDTMSAEELREKLSASEGKVDEMSATIEKLTGAIEKMDATQREKDLQARAEAFEAFAIPVDEYVAQMGKLEELDPEVAEWVDAKFAAADKVIGETAVLEELGTDAENEAVGPDKFMQLIDAKRKEDKVSYAEAMKAVTAEHPDLAAEYHLKGMGG